MLIHNDENNNNNVLNNGFNVKNIETEFQKQIQTNNNNNIDPIISNEISFNIWNEWLKKNIYLKNSRVIFI